MATKKTTTNPSTRSARSGQASLEAVIYSQKGTKAGTITLSEKVFGATWNGDLVHEVVTSMMSNKRAGTAHTKDRSEVSGGGKKPWKQKGTGRARHGSTRSPIWVGGGVTFGPRNDKDYSKKINKKARVKALYTTLSRQYGLGHIMMLDTLALSAIKTKDAHAVLADLAKVENFEGLKVAKKNAALVVLPEISTEIAKSFANLPGVTLVATAELNPMLVMNARRVVMVDPTKTLEVLESKMK